VRWERLFADLEAQYDAAAQAELAAEVADRSRRELATIRLADRIRTTTGQVHIGVTGCEPIQGSIAACGPDWVLLADATVEVLVPLAAVSWVRGLSTVADPATSAVAAKLDLGYALRGIARDRAEVTVTLRAGERLTGTVDRVGADFIDLAEHPVGEPRRTGSVQSVRTVAFDALAALRRQ